MALKPRPQPARRPVRPAPSPDRRKSPGRRDRRYVPPAPKKAPAPAPRPFPTGPSPWPSRPPRPRVPPAAAPGSDKAAKFAKQAGKFLKFLGRANKAYDFGRQMFDLIPPDWWGSTVPGDWNDHYTVGNWEIWFDYSSEWGVCNYRENFWPGRWLAGYEVQYFAQGNMYKNAPWATCGTFGTNADWQPGVYTHPSGIQEMSFYSRMYDPAIPGQFENYLPFVGFSTYLPVPARPVEIAVVPLGSPEPVHPGIRGPAGMPEFIPPNPIEALVPAAKPLLAPGTFNPYVPVHLQTLRRGLIRDLHSQQGLEPGNTEGAPSRPPVPKPGRPPRGTRERKMIWRGKAALAAAKKILNSTTEACDAVDAVWDALPGNVKWVPGVPQGCKEKAAAILANLDQVDLPQALWNLIYNHYEDKAYGKYFGAYDKAAKNLGLKGFKLDQLPGNGIDFLNESGVDQQTIADLINGYLKGV